MLWGTKVLPSLKATRAYVINSKYDALRNTQYNLRSVFASTLKSWFKLYFIIKLQKTWDIEERLVDTKKN